MSEPGSTCTLRITWWGDAPRPVEGDILRSDPGGSCYRVDRVRFGRIASHEGYVCTRLGRDAAPADSDGVFLFRWLPRGRR